jgi:hypothetical protein
MSGCLGQLFQQSGLQLPQPPTTAELQADPTAPLPPAGGFVNVPLSTFPQTPLLQTGAFAVPQTMTLLTPKFGTGGSLICGSNLVKKIRLGEGRFIQKDSAKEPAVGNWLPFGKETVCADFVGLRDDVARAERTNGWISDRT